MATFVLICFLSGLCYDSKRLLLKIFWACYKGLSHQGYFFNFLLILLMLINKFLFISFILLYLDLISIKKKYCIQKKQKNTGRKSIVILRHSTRVQKNVIELRGSYYSGYYWISSRG